MPTIDKLPGPEDGADGLRKLVEAFGPEQVFQLIRLVRLAKGTGEDLNPAGAVAAETAQAMVADAQRDDPSLDYNAARQKVAARLGYVLASARGVPQTASSFYNILRGEPRPRGAGAVAARREQHS